ncbi:hypothetical protein RJC02_05985 [Staphylococcus epidermidis]|uniref:hypothetical protein n=1 Tax=Staphylococcus epidermidis TaxID=1282 RepID=UPI00287891AE|nr:hypothetical protein [Staphylococcus epidermidis]MDS3956181.1 hypothetical protein [Staphylococcus epidermidis]
MAEVKLSQESYDELLADITTLRAQADIYFEKWQDAKKTGQAFDIINNTYSTEIDQAVKNKQLNLNQCLFLLEQILDDLEANNEG